MLKRTPNRRRAVLEQLEQRWTMDGGCFVTEGIQASGIDPPHREVRDIDAETDVNRDGAVTAHDAIIVSRHLAQSSPLQPCISNKPQQPVDINGDRQLSAIDLLLVVNELNRYLQLDPTKVEQSSIESAFDYDPDNQVILMDTTILSAHRRRFDITFGSITLETMHVFNDLLTFRYTPEVEGGYKIYECRVPVSEEPIQVRIDPSGVPGTTSFSLADCLLIEKGSLFW